MENYYYILYFEDGSYTDRLVTDNYDIVSLPKSIEDYTEDEVKNFTAKVVYTTDPNGLVGFYNKPSKYAHIEYDYINNCSIEIPTEEEVFLLCI